MIDNSILNAVLDLAWYATSLRLKVGQEPFHAFFTLLAPFGVPAYRYYFQTTSPQYNFTPRQWIAYTIAYCVLLLATRDAVEYLTLGHPLLDHTLTVCRITLAVFWFSIFRTEDDDDRLTSVIRGMLIATHDLILTDLVSQVPSELIYMIMGVVIGTAFLKWNQSEAGSLHRWFAHKFPWVTRDHIAVFVIVLTVIAAKILFAYVKARILSLSSFIQTALTYEFFDARYFLLRLPIPPHRTLGFGVYLLWHVALVNGGLIPPGTYGLRNVMAAIWPTMPGVFLLHLQNDNISGTATDYVRIIFGDWILPWLLTPAQVIYRRGLMTINNLAAHIRVPKALSRLILISILAGVGYLRYTHSSSPSNLSSSASFAISPNSQPNVVEVPQVNNPLQVLANPNTTSPARSSAKHNPKISAVAVVTASSAKERTPLVELYEHEEVVIEVINIGQVCYDEDGVKLPCPRMRICWLRLLWMWALGKY